MAFDSLVFVESHAEEADFPQHDQNSICLSADKASRKGAKTAKENAKDQNNTFAPVVLCCPDPLGAFLGAFASLREAEGTSPGVWQIDRQSANRPPGKVKTRDGKIDFGTEFARKTPRSVLESNGPDVVQ